MKRIYTLIDARQVLSKTIKQVAEQEISADTALAINELVKTALLTFPEDVEPIVRPPQDGRP